MGGRPWTFDGQVLLMKEISGDEQPSEVVFSKSPFWVRLLDVPFGRRNPSFAYDIGEDLGGFIEFDDSDPLGWEAFMRIKVLVDIDKPLRRVVKVASGGRGDKGEKWIGLKYERVGDLCFFCGRLGHSDRDCQFLETQRGSSQTIVY